MGKYRIITFDGGGLKGVLSATLLKRIKDIFPNFIRKADFLAGTSTGGLISLGLAYGLTPEALIKFYKKEGSFIFQPKSIGLYTTKYDNKNLIKVLKSVFPEDLRLRHLKKHVLITAFEVKGPNGETWGPVFFNNFQGSRTRFSKVIDVALATSAVPSYLPSHKNCIDGGVVATNPSTAAICQTIDQLGDRLDLDEICLLSIGTGYRNLKINVDTSDWGILQWIQFNNPSRPILSLMLDGMVQTTGLYSSQLLGERYFRVNPELTKKIDMGDYKAIPYLIEVGEKYDLKPVIQWMSHHW